MKRRVWACNADAGRKVRRIRIQFRMFRSLRFDDQNQRVNDSTMATGWRARQSLPHRMIQAHPAQTSGYRRRMDHGGARPAATLNCCVATARCHCVNRATSSPPQKMRAFPTRPARPAIPFMRMTSCSVGLNRCDHLAAGKVSNSVPAPPPAAGICGQGQLWRQR